MLTKTKKPARLSGDEWVKVAKNVLKECRNGLSDGIQDETNGTICVMAAISVATGESERADPEDRPSCVHPNLQSLGIELNDGEAWSDDKSRGQGMAAFAVACLNTARHKANIQKIWDAFEIEYVRSVVPLIVSNSDPGDDNTRSFFELLVELCEKVETTEMAQRLRSAFSAIGNLNKKFDIDFPFANIAHQTNNSNAIMEATCKAATVAIKAWRKESADLLKKLKIK